MTSKRILSFIFLSISLASPLCGQSREYFRDEILLSLVNPRVNTYKKCDCVLFETDSLNFMFYAITPDDGHSELHYIYVHFFYKGNSYIIVDWINATLDGNPLVVNLDEATYGPLDLTTYSWEKDSILPHQLIVTTQHKSDGKPVTSMKYIIEHETFGRWVDPIYGQKEREPKDIHLHIPLIYPTDTICYDFTLRLERRNKEDADSIYDMRQYYKEISRKVKKGMRIEEAKKILGEPETISQRGYIHYYPGVKIFYDHNMFVRKKEI